MMTKSLFVKWFLSVVSSCTTATCRRVAGTGSNAMEDGTPVPRSQGAVVISGRVNLEQWLFAGHDDVDSIEMYAWYNETEPMQSAVRVDQPDGRSRLTDYALGMDFDYDATGALVGCEPMDSHDAVSELSFLEQQSRSGGAVFVSGQDTDGTVYQGQVEQVTVRSRPAPVTPPSVEQCEAVMIDQIADVKARRRLAKPDDSGRFEPLDDIANISSIRQQPQRRDSGCDWRPHMAYASYKDQEDADLHIITSAGWSEVDHCEERNAFSRLWKHKDGLVAVGFGGSDDLDDWLLNIGGIYNPSNGVHGGFDKYVDMIQSCTDNMAQKHGKITYFVGHSLGGAAATLYHERSCCKADDARVFTIGAPATHQNPGEDCPIPGLRRAHKKDPIASSKMGKPSNWWGQWNFFTSPYHHRVARAQFYEDTSRRRGLLSLTPKTYEWVDQSCSQNTDSGLCSMTYYAITAHRAYLGYDHSC